MKIRLDQVVDEPFDWQETLDPSGQTGLPEVLEFGQVACRGRILPMHSGYLLEASLAYRQALSCMRCLSSFEMPVASEVSLMIQIQGPQAPVAELELTSEDLGAVLLEEPEIDTHPLLVEQLNLGVPMKPLCREDCAGLCAACGADLNAGSCDCQQETDPRWNALLGLRS